MALSIASAETPLSRALFIKVSEILDVSVSYRISGVTSTFSLEANFTIIYCWLDFASIFGFWARAPGF